MSEGESGKQLGEGVAQARSVYLLRRVSDDDQACEGKSNDTDIVGEADLWAGGFGSGPHDLQNGDRSRQPTVRLLYCVFLLFGNFSMKPPATLSEIPISSTFPESIHVLSIWLFSSRHDGYR